MLPRSASVLPRTAGHSPRQCRRRVTPWRWECRGSSLCRHRSSQQGRAIDGALGPHLWTSPSRGTALRLFPPVGRGQSLSAVPASTSGWYYPRAFNALAWCARRIALACSAEAAWPAALQALAARAAVAYRLWTGDEDNSSKWRRSAGTSALQPHSPPGEMSTYPVAALPSRVARMEEADEPLLAVKRGRPPLHQLLVHFREERNRGRAWSRATARAEEPIISPRGLGTRRCARLQPRSRGGPGKHGRQLWVWFGGGRDTRGVQLRRIFILRGRLPIHRCRDRHLILYRRAKWNAGHAVRRHSRITGEPHRTAAAGGVKGPWGLTRRKALTVALRSPRALADGSLLVAEKPARVVTEGASPIPERRERCDRSAAMVTRSERTHKPSTNAASARWMPRHWRQRSWLSTEDRKRPQPRGHGRNSVFKKTWTGRDFALLGNLLF